ncbi:unnamed protein product [Coffea canephora]|uniref:RRM domain-containing protein n=1 Tax=Coffea canephora TaxID=49390 RepID=A0A068UIK7_COFCA|nr:unnamed protein product [Coffea canephora]
MYFPVGDPYWRCSVPPQPERGSSPKQIFVGYLSSEASMLMTPHLWSSNDGKGSSDYLGKDILQSHPGAYGIDVWHIHPETGLGGLTSGTSIRGYPSPLRDPSSLGQRPDVASHPRESNILFVDGLPTDCSRREVGHLFRPFIGFRELRVVHKEPRHAKWR